MTRKAFLITLIVVAGVLPILWYVLFFDHESGIKADETIRYIPLIDQAAVVVTAFVIKPLYMLVSLALAWRLRRSSSPDLVALRWGMIAFFVGEAFCSINYLVFQDKSVLSEYLHNFGMVVAFGFFAYAFLEGMDRHIVQYSHPRKRCALIGLCEACVKNQDVPCRFRQLFQLGILVLSLLVFIPLLAQIREISYYTYIFDTLYNYTRLKAHQLFEIRYAPLLALVMFLSAFVVVQKPGEKQVPDLARIFLAAGIGALGFGVFRLFFGSVFAQNLAWAASWEEITEFLLMIIIPCVLWVFRKALAI